MKRNLNFNLISVIVVAAVITMAASMVYFSIEGFGGNAGDEGRAAVEEALRKASVQCYALEGSYPPDLEYLVQHYGIVINEDRFYYHYELIGSNIMPDIAVLRKQNDAE
ncbi:MAG: hypothetical protein HGA22_00335 [Clostridiales bacterium]|nr:hypothetical protein [Clostridiales bacterium]